ncbi:DUF4214 domain-containing protein [Paraburkholderia sp. MMS20-SJTR3]|uniref:DUF4214 domain-containing protein n=1 Tax=Paraburkholderia sejongensis TaxID=2886946 RepID=A0ABS8K4R9_9BURK|nr:DUF4214 domain-containing protein [Paraburkholderia sp. MMS20-SJTR3]MCC8396975.1 DUF4214 domain-containing protein [Paraburkholderia sp. MMS20-SJTR3]
MEHHTGDLSTTSVAALFQFDGQHFVRRCYLTLLGRDIDAAGMTYYSTELGKKKGRAAILHSIFGSSEFRKRHKHRSLATSYRVLFTLSRLPAIGGLFESIRRKRFESVSVSASTALLLGEIAKLRDEVHAVRTTMTGLSQQVAALQAGKTQIPPAQAHQADLLRIEGNQAIAAEILAKRIEEKLRQITQAK